MTVESEEDKTQVQESTTLKKAELLRHYMETEPHQFVQWDGFFCPESLDPFIYPDSNGHCIIHGDTWELMSGCSEVRVLVRPDVTKENAVALLLKIAVYMAEEKNHGREPRSDSKKVTPEQLELPF